MSAKIRWTPSSWQKQPDSRWDCRTLTYSIPGSRKRPTLLGYLCLGLNEPIVSTLPKLDFQLHFLSPKTRASHFHMEAHDKVLVRLSDYSEVFVRNASRYHAAAGLAAIAVGAEKTIYLCKAQDYLRILVLELQKETVETFVLSHSGHSAPQGSWKIVFPIKSRSKNTSPNGVNFAALINRVVQRLLNIR